MKKLIAKEKRNRRGFSAWATGVAAALALLVALPNFSMAAARTLGDLPVVGSLFRVVTLRAWEEESDTLSARVELPKVLSESYPAAAEKINREVDAMADEATAWLEDAAGPATLDIRSSTLTDSPLWFSLKVTVFRARGGGYEQSRIFTVSKAAGKLLELEDLLTGSGIRVAEEDLLRQMGADSAYEFSALPEEQDFYVTAEGDLVLSFDEYEIAPGSMGAPEFTVSGDLLAPYAKVALR